MGHMVRVLALQGSLMLVVGLLCGFPYGRAINRKSDADVVLSWRVSHSSLSAGAILIIAIAAMLPWLPTTPALNWVTVVSLIVSSWAFTFALTVGPALRHRGLKFEGTFGAKAVYFGNIFGAAFSLVAALALLCSIVLSF